MAKNIVLCSDGTGNSGGKGTETNVWRLYQAIKRNLSGCEQIAFHDDGVGTEDNKYWKLFSGTVGWGFTRNVKDLYKALVKNYSLNDDIYMFGFSRGAYTVRALAAFVATCGVIRKARAMTEGDLDANIDKLIRAYWARTDGEVCVKDDDVTCDYPDIQCVGVWDTVGAIGTPFDLLIKQLVQLFFMFGHRDRVLSPKVKHGFHAVAIDDERLTFHPVMWESRNDIEQVWFAGMHSNVGGGYPKQGIAYVSLDWMMEKVQKTDKQDWGLYFDEGLRDAARHHANVDDKLYNSRAGLAAYYRLRPRDIESLTPGDEAMIHDSVFDRIDSKTLAYNPGNIPANKKIKVVTTPGTPPQTARQNRANTEKARKSRQKLLRQSTKWTDRRKALHLAFTLTSILVGSAMLQLAAAVYLPDPFGKYAVPILAATIIVIIMASMRRIRYRVLCLAALAVLAFFAFASIYWFGGPIELPEFVASGLAFVLPDLLAEIIVRFTEERPLAVAAFVAVGCVMHWLKINYRSKSNKLFEQLCDTFRA